MKENYTEIAAIVDQSGSMFEKRHATIEGFNGFVAEQRALPGEARMTLVLFNNTATRVAEGVDIQDIPLLDEASYQPVGGTALLDAIGETVTRLGQRLEAMPESERPAHVLVMVLTDGQENASYFCSPSDIAAVIKRQEEVYNWTFVFLASELQTLQAATWMNVQPENAIAMAAGGQGVSDGFIAMNRISTQVRTGN